jgi:hypothetical protein
MSKPRHLHLSDLRGLQRLAADATLGVTDLVETMHRTIAGVPGILGDAPTGRTRGITGFVYKSVRGVTRVVGDGVDALLGALEPIVAQAPSSPQREAVLAIVNGVFGDYLEASGNPLAIPLQFRAQGLPLATTAAALGSAFPAPTRGIVVLAHGLCMNELHWNRSGHDHGATLSRDLELAPVYLHYNSGRHISVNGRAFADALEALVRAWPHPPGALAIVGHSMGGLVAGSACHYAALAGHAWLRQLDNLVFLGTPHFGAPLERAGAWADYLIGVSPYSAPFARLGKTRSAGIKDLRHGDIRDEDWQMPARAGTHGRRPTVPLPAGVRSFAIAASRQERPGAPGARVRGDGLVPVASALGRHADGTPGLALPDEHCRVVHGTGHFDLLDSPQVYHAVRDCLNSRR